MCRNIGLNLTKAHQKNIFKLLLCSLKIVYTFAPRNKDGILSFEIRENARALDIKKKYKYHRFMFNTSAKDTYKE